MLKLDTLRVLQALRPRTTLPPAEFEAMLNAAADEAAHHAAVHGGPAC